MASVPIGQAMIQSAGNHIDQEYCGKAIKAEPEPRNIRRPGRGAPHPSHLMHRALIGKIQPGIMSGMVLPLGYLAERCKSKGKRRAIKTIRTV